MAAGADVAAGAAVVGVVIRIDALVATTTAAFLATILLDALLSTVTSEYSLSEWDAA